MKHKKTRRELLKEWGIWLPKLLFSISIPMIFHIIARWFGFEFGLEQIWYSRFVIIIVILSIILTFYVMTKTPKEHFMEVFWMSSSNHQDDEINNVETNSHNDKK